MAPTPTLADRVLVLEEANKPLQEARGWLIAIIAGGILSLGVGGMAWGALMERLEHVAADVDTVSAEVQELRQDLNARGQVGAR